eukprot:MONOS_359.1-p1 / transcript=MONOS_359.1 / gene=MONOS_359 / organism=Monocercomonoides_exilis_PA203 / gene_product=Ate1 / transcript_product=Ate1 / location=Mono_scaffold00006:32476-35472(+) / protein_length=850 / sequence_SO=supercontig / SO=protein_coding / is_pseudo=false
MKPSQYEHLVNHGFRRSGSYCYRYYPWFNCCPQYSIRVDIDKFIASHSNHRDIRRFFRFLDGDWPPSEKALHSKDNISANASTFRGHANAKDVSSAVKKLSDVRAAPPPFEGPLLPPNIPLPNLYSSPRPLPVFINKPLNFSTLIPAKLQKSRYEGDYYGRKSEETTPKTLLLCEIVGRYHTFTIGIRTAAPTEESFELYDKYQRVIHSVKKDKNKKSTAKPESEEEDGKEEDEEDDDDDVPTMESFTNFLCNKGPKFRLEPALNYLERHPKVVYQLFKQEKQESEKASEKERNEATLRSYSELVFGAYHMEYRLDGKLVGVSVVDLCPTLLSSVYFFYDPKYRFLTLGYLSMLMEMDLMREIRKQFNWPILKYYHLGLYSALNVKTSVKCKLFPSELLCPISFAWVPAHLFFNSYSPVTPFDIDFISLREKQLKQSEAKESYSNKDAPESKDRVVEQEKATSSSTSSDSALNTDASLSTKPSSSTTSSSEKLSLFEQQLRFYATIYPSRFADLREKALKEEKEKQERNEVERSIDCDCGADAMGDGRDAILKENNEAAKNNMALERISGLDIQSDPLSISSSSFSSSSSSQPSSSSSSSSSSATASTNPETKKSSSSSFLIQKKHSKAQQKTLTTLIPQYPEEFSLSIFHLGQLIGLPSRPLIVHRDCPVWKAKTENDMATEEEKRKMRNRLRKGLTVDIVREIKKLKKLGPRRKEGCDCFLEPSDAEINDSELMKLDEEKAILEEMSPFDNSPKCKELRCDHSIWDESEPLQLTLDPKRKIIPKEPRCAAAYFRDGTPSFLYLCNRNEEEIFAKLETMCGKEFTNEAFPYIRGSLLQKYLYFHYEVNE